MRARFIVAAASILLMNATWSGSEIALASNPESGKTCDVLSRSAPGLPRVFGFSLNGLCGLGVERRFSYTLSNEAYPQVTPAADLQLRIGVARPGGGHAVITVPLETYVARVLAGEAVRDSQPAALEALAIAVRTYTLANRGRHRADGFDLCDETHCQVMRTASAATERAATATAGRALVIGGAPASIYYSASCGGRTEIPSEVWPGADDPPYLPSRPDDGCGGAPVWSAELSAADLLRAFRAGGFGGARLGDLRIAWRNSSGRVARLRIDGLNPDAISGQDLRVVVGRTLGWQFIKSTAFELKRTGDRYQFSGHGSGHGVGMCVVGSTQLAVAGQSADQILRRYYPGLAIGRPLVTLGAASADTEARPTRRNAPPPAAPAAAASPLPPAAPPPMVSDVLVSLPDGDEGERGFITDMAARARTDLSRALGVPAPRVTLRFHPTVDSYERATQEPWFTSGAIVNGEVHLLPPAILRERGVLERTLRHELVHVMTNTALAGRPLWVREGAAIYFAGARARPGEPYVPSVDLPRTSCPNDAELRRPVSAGALSNAYARAQSCFVRDLVKRKSWRDIK